MVITTTKAHLCVDRHWRMGVRQGRQTASLGHFETRERIQSLRCNKWWRGANLPLVKAFGRLRLYF